MTTGTIPVETLDRVSKYIAAHFGLNFPPERYKELEKGLISAAREMDCHDVKECIQEILSAELSSEQIEVLASHLTIGETYFYREYRNFDVFRNHILPELINSRKDNERKIRIWSAACSSGEEAYTIAIIIRELLKNIQDWNVTILASDINIRALKKAGQGIYTEWSFRHVPPGFKEKYFTKMADKKYEILPVIKKMVSFSFHNLIKDSYPSLHNNTNAMDVIFCRNAIMYFGLKERQEVVRRFYQSLSNGGWLFVSPAETSQQLFAQFATVNFPGAILYRKISEQTKKTGYRKPKQTSSVSMRRFVLRPGSESEATKRKILAAESLKKVQPEQLQATYKDALDNFLKGRYQEAIATLEQLITQNKNINEATALMAKAKANQGKLCEALEWCEKVLTMDKLNPSLHYLRATILLEQDKVEEARQALNRVIYLDRNFILAHYTLGNLAHLQGNRAAAERHFKNALDLLKNCKQDDVLPESEGVSAGRLREIVASMLV